MSVFTNTVHDKTDVKLFVSQVFSIEGIFRNDSKVGWSKLFKSMWKSAIGGTVWKEPVDHSLVQPNTADPRDLEKYLVDMPRDYEPKRNTCRIRGDAVLRLAAPAGTKIAWLSVGATFRTYQGEQAKRTDNRIAYPVGKPEGFKEIYKSSVPTWINHWRYNWDTDILLYEPADVFIKISVLSN